MDFMLWATRTIHLFSVVVWVGALLYNAVVIFPAWRAEGAPVLDQMVTLIPFLWTGIVTVGVSGICLMLFDSRFVFFSYPDWWSIALGLKQVAFLVMAILSFGFARMVKRLQEMPIAREESMVHLLSFRAFQLNKSAIFVGIVALMLASSMHY